LKNIAAGKFSSVKEEKFKEEIWVELFFGEILPFPKLLFLFFAQ
tara:strand:+ start:2650 stop:2781 length:132 start_codon:yes stop_codon:yes gene_type:complete